MAVTPSTGTISRSSSNEMTRLLNKIERRLGTSTLSLPDSIGKDYWPTIIVNQKCCKDGFYFIDMYLPEGTKIIGVEDVDWTAYRCDPRFDRYGINFATVDFISRDYAIDDVAFTQIGADFMSLFNLGIYVEFEYPNKVRLVSVNGSPVSRNRPFPLKVFIEHPTNLMTISPTMMETFERLAQADVAAFLYQQLKFYDGTDTVYTQIDLKLETLLEWSNRRDDIVKELDEAHVTASNEFQSLIMTV